MDKATFRLKLDATHVWPCRFMFKFIMRPVYLREFKNLFPKDDWRKRESARGRYVCVTMERDVDNADDVIGVYDRAATIPGVMLL